jgi:hypothetical protein
MSDEAQGFLLTITHQGSSQHKGSAEKKKYGA